MSVKITFIRLSAAVNQVNFDRCGVISTRTYSFVEIGTRNWQGGARNRVKTLSLDRALAYLNKLYEGHWLCEEDYHAAYVIVDELICTRTVFKEPGMLPTEFARYLASQASKKLSAWEDLPCQFQFVKID